MVKLTPDRALIFRITHIANIPWILQHGLQCQASGNFDPAYHNIGNPELIEKRKLRVVPIAPGGTLDSYVPFYFTPHSPMLLNIKTGHNGIQQRPMSDIVILAASLHDLLDQNVKFVFTDRHAYLKAAQFSADLADLPHIAWDLLQTRDFQTDPEKPEKKERYQAEALIHRHLPIDGVRGMICYDSAREKHLKNMIAAENKVVPVAVNQSYYF